MWHIRPLHYFQNVSISTLLKAGPARACLSLIHSLKSRRFIIFSLLIAFIISAVVATPTQNVLAATKTSDLSTTDMAKSFAAYRWLRSCMERGNFTGENAPGAINQPNVNSFKWFTAPIWGFPDVNVSTGGVINDTGGRDNNQGDVSCGDDEGVTLLKTATSIWGYSSGADLLCDIGFTRDVGSACNNIAASGVNNFNKPSDAPAALDTWWKNKLGNSSTDISSIANGGEYALYLQSFLVKCGIASTNGEYTIQTFAANSKTPTATKYTAVNTQYKQDSSVKIYQDNSLTCSQLADKINDPTDQAVLGYIKYLTAHDGVDSAPPNTCPPESTDASCAGTKATTTCSIEGLGWIICPATTLIASITDALYGWVQNFLFVQPLNVDTGNANNTTYQAWSAMRNLANVAFVIAFLIIIFSQLTNMGVSNYGVKKMLPRLVVAAILVNLSYWITALAIDISNIVGSNIYSILRSPAGIPIGNITAVGNLWENVLGGLLAGGTILGVTAGGVALAAAGTAAVAAAGTVVMWAAITFVLAALLAIIVAFIILAARQALIIILVVLSPLAFVAFLLPNTEKLFTSWRKALLTLLVFYPLFSVLFGGSYLAGMIIIGSAGQGNQDAGVGGPAVGMTILLGMAIMIVPLALTPLLIKFSTGIMGTVAGMANNKSKGLIDRARNVRNRKASLAMNETLGHPNNQRNPFGRLYRRINNSAAGDAQRKKTIEANKQSAYLGTRRAEELSIAGGNAEQVAHTLEAEHKAEFEQQKSGELALRENIASVKVKARGANDQANFEELKSTSQAIPAGHPVAAGIQEARDAQRTLDIDNSRARFAGNVDQQELARALQSDPGLAAQMGGIAGARGAESVRSSAQYTLQQAVIEEIKAERSQIASVADMTDLKTRYASATTAARRAAIAERMITIGKPDDYMSIVDAAGSNTSTDADDVVFRQTVSQALSQNGPQSLKASDIDAISSGTLATRSGPNTLIDTVRANVEAGVYSQEKLAAETADNLRFAWDNASLAGRTELTSTAVELIANDNLNGKIKHNKKAITDISTNTAP